MKKLKEQGPYPISLIMVDLDNLKFVNNTLGHKSGDQPIKKIAKILRESIRNYHMVARIGGDEFTILLEETRKEGV